MGGSRLGFDLLGPLLMTVAGTPAALGTPKRRAVLAMLLINRNRAVGMESLVNATGDQSPAPGAQTSIHSYLAAWNAIQAVNDEGVDGLARRTHSRDQEGSPAMVRRPSAEHVHHQGRRCRGRPQPRLLKPRLADPRLHRHTSGG